MVDGDRAVGGSALNAPRGPELRQEAQPGSKLTFISEDVLLKAAAPRFRKQLVTVRDLGQDRGREGGRTGRTGRGRETNRETEGHGQTQRFGETGRDTQR